MLRDIVLIFTEFYKEKIENSSSLAEFKRGMEQQHAKVHLYGKDFLKKEHLPDKQELFEELCLQETLFLSDDKEVLEKLRSCECFTLACYHEQVEGILGTTQYAIEGLEGIEWEYLNRVYQRYKGIPWEITETNRCRIREMGPDDLDDLCELYADKRVTQYTEALFQNKDEEKKYIEDYIENIYKYYGFGTWLIHRKVDGKLIGRAGFNYRPGFDEAELGFVIGYPFWKKGYAYEVCSHLLKLGKEVYEFDKIQALVDKENEGSLRLLKKLGFYYVEEVKVDGHEYRRYLYE